MKVTDVNGQVIAIVTTALSLIIALATAFHWANITSQENTALMVVATAAVGLGVYVWTLLHSWATASYDLSRATTLVTAFVAALIAVLDAFGVFKFDANQQTALLGVAGGIAFIGGLLYSYLHTAHQIMLLKQQIAMRQSQGVGSMSPARSR
jgi:hypothetical protein